MQPCSTTSIHSPGVGEVGVGSTFPQQVSHKHHLSRKSPLGALDPSRVATNYPMCPPSTFQTLSYLMISTIPHLVLGPDPLLDPFAYSSLHLQRD